MPGFPGTAFRGTTILSTVHRDHGIFPTQTASGGAVWPAINRAIYTPVLVEEIVVVTQMVVWPTAQSGNLDIGIYSETGTRLVSSGSTAVGAANALQAVNVTDTTLDPGVYFLALCVDNTTAAFQRANPGLSTCRSLGVQQQAVGAVTLPATATFANPATAYVPVVQALVMSAVI